jgi:hypothetical protein
VNLLRSMQIFYYYRRFFREPHILARNGPYRIGLLA